MGEGGPWITRFVRPTRWVALAGGVVVEKGDVVVNGGTRCVQPLLQHDAIPYLHRISH